MEQARVLSLVLADQCVGDAQGQIVVISQGRQDADLRDGLGQALGLQLEAGEVVHAAGGQAVEVPGHSRLVVVEERGDGDDAGDVMGQEFADVGIASGTGAVLVKRCV